MAGDKPTLDFGGAFSAAGSKLADYISQIPSPISSVGLSTSADSEPASSGNDSTPLEFSDPGFGSMDFGGAASAAGSKLSDYAGQAGRSVKRGLMSAGSSFNEEAHKFAPNADKNASSFLSNLSQPVQDLLDTVRVFYKQLPDQFKKYVTTLYNQFQGNAPQTQARPGAGPPDNISAPLPQGHSAFAPDNIHAPIAALEGRPGNVHSQMAAVAASKNTQVTHPLSNHPLASNPAHREPEKGTPVSANRLADNATLGDAVAFFMANDNLSRKDAFDAAQKYIAKRDQDRDVGVGEPHGA